MELGKLIVERLETLIEEHIELYPCRDHHDIKPIYHENKSDILGLANAYISLYNKCPYVKVGGRK